MSSDALELEPPSARKYVSVVRQLGGRTRRTTNKRLKLIGVAIGHHRELTTHCFDANNLHLAEVVTAAQRMSNKTSHEKRTWLFDRCRQRSDNLKKFIVASDSGQVSVCTTCFAKYHGVGRSTVARTLHQIKSGQQRPNLVVRDTADTVKRAEVKSWLTDLYLNYGDYMPDDFTICLPVYNRQKLFDWYLQSPTVEELYQYAAFCRVLADEFPFISFRRYKKFMQCCVCNELDGKINLEKVICAI